jgi:hypothetical protein
VDLLERVLAIADAFDEARVPHSFGGAIALGYYGLVRGTHDIDVNVYLDVDRAGRALDALSALGVPPADAAQREEIRRRGQTRLRWEGVPLDLFFANLAFHASCRARTRRHVLMDRTIDVLGPEDLIVCKVAFARPKDGRDVEAMLDNLGQGLDVAYVLRWVEAIVGLDTAAARALVAGLASRALAPERL